MKNLTIALFLGLSTLASADDVTPRNSSQKLLVSTLDHGTLDPAMFKDHEFNGAQVEINLTKARVTLSVYPDCVDCRTPPFTLSLPLVSAKKGACNVTTYVAHPTIMSMGGIWDTITIEDNSRNTCMYLNAIPDTRVVHTRSQAVYPPVQIKSSFTGGALELIEKDNSR